MPPSAATAAATAAAAMAAATAAATTGPQWFKRAQRSLLAGKTRISGNHVSPSKRHVRRHWLPNVQMKRLWSDVLARHIRINVTPFALKQMDRMGGVDNYLLFTRPDKLQSRTGLALRRLLEDQIAFKERVARKYGVGAAAAPAAAAAEAAAQQDSIAATLAELEAVGEPVGEHVGEPDEAAADGVLEGAAAAVARGAARLPAELR